MTDAQINAIQQHRFVVRVFWPETRRFETLAFATDIRALWFMERAANQGATILECRAPVDRVAA